MISFYSYIFYRTTSFRDEKVSTSNSPFATILLMSIVFNLYFVLTTLIVESFFNFNSWSGKIFENRTTIFLFIAVGLLGHWFLFEKKTNYEKLKAKFSGIEGYKRKRKDLLTVIYLLFPFIFIPVFLFTR